MVVRYIDNGKRAIFNELIFTRDEKTGYFLNSTVHQRLHRAVYEYYNGAIPSGFHVHHIDHNRGNNEPENLIAISRADHNRIHADEMPDEIREKLRANLEKNARPAANKWHGSAEGREWHQKHYADTREMLHKREWMVCECCGQRFNGATNGTARFCSNACKSAWRRKAGIDNVVKCCEYCGREFTSNKYANVHTCSRSCANRMRALYSRKTHSENVG